jgi:hypothetical protein
MKNTLLTVAMLMGSISCFLFSLDNRAQNPWPTIRPLTWRFHFVDKKAQVARTRIHDVHGNPLYMLECCLNAYDYANNEFDYSGAFECRLTSLYSNETFSTLLTEERDQVRDWQSRGRFMLQEIEGKCAAYPEYGRIRSFRLRGMILRLDIKDIKMDRGSRINNAPWFIDRIEDLYLSVSVVPDSKALSATAEVTKYLSPPYVRPGDPNDMSRNCEKVLMRK